MFKYKHVALTLGAATLLSGSFFAGYAYAADARLDAANQNVSKAITLLQAAENPNNAKNPFGGHRIKAIALLRRASAEIQKAKDHADKPPKPPHHGHGHGPHHKDKNKKKDK